MTAATCLQEASPGLLTLPSLGRLLASLIRAEQSDLIAKGQMPRAAGLILSDPRLTDAALADLTIDEEGLGFDSLSRLSLVLRLNRFFGLSTTGVEDYLLVQRRFGDWVGLIAEHVRLMSDSLVLTFDTSGSSGPVKHIPHAINDLVAEIRGHLHGPLSDLPPGRVLTMVPPHHIYGCLFSVLLPEMIGRAVVDLHLLPPTALFRQARAGDLVVGTPFTWGLVAQSGLRLPEGVRGLTSAAPATAETFTGAATCGLAQLTEIFGATETGGIATRAGFGAPFTLLPHLTREGEEVRHRDILPLQDRLDWLSDRQFHLLGRKDDVVQIGGVNVSPAHVQSLLAALPGVAEVAVRLGQDRLKAFVVPAPDATEADLTAGIAALCLGLPAPARPAALRFGPRLPRNPMGKLSDWKDDGTLAG
ncbi:4-coumarate--CoA ligase [Rhodobacter sp. KR11]|uniref:4-coumarate--CoA ligase n=1 Tax=Rhodobacter sp. KR11 TaxID=2974588 RepID=UPI0022225F8F|nr:4-coumarate--CoA ligase [Rhodobacter sp. KR11]MCW1917410.1 4-coumarate--CoA ligase [Rhodobacter sp. KR11]